VPLASQTITRSPLACRQRVTYERPSPRQCAAQVPPGVDTRRRERRAGSSVRSSGSHATLRATLLLYERLAANDVMVATHTLEAMGYVTRFLTPALRVRWSPRIVLLLRTRRSEASDSRRLMPAAVCGPSNTLVWCQTWELFVCRPASGSSPTWRRVRRGNTERCAKKPLTTTSKKRGRHVLWGDRDRDQKSAEPAKRVLVVDAEHRRGQAADEDD
jgi:hypothetical protein